MIFMLHNLLTLQIYVEVTNEHLTRSREVRDWPGSKGSWLGTEVASVTTPQVMGSV